nr:MAG TPA: hypothetical protein [Caudoviricetes sp.]
MLYSFVPVLSAFSTSMIRVPLSSEKSYLYESQKLSLCL